MRTANPTLSESAFNRMTQGAFAQPGAVATPYVRTGTFTIEGAIYKTALLLGIAVVAGVGTVTVVPESAWFPVIIGAAIGGLVLALVTTFKPNVAHVTAPLYAVAEGAFLGIITLLFEDAYPGIAVQAAIGTGAVLAVMLVLYRTGVIRVTQKFRMIVMVATGAIFLTYLVSFIVGLFTGGGGASFLHNSSALSIGLSVVIIVVAALNLALDFDFIEAAAQRGAPARTEWYAAFGLLVTLVWLYLEILRLLAKLQSRR